MEARRTRRIALAAAALAAAAALLWWWLRPAAAPPVAYETAVVQRAPVTERVTATGTLSPRVEVQVGSQVSGRIQELLVDFNDPVTAGQVIARIDPRLFEAELAKARANLAAAEAAVDKARADLTDARLKAERARGLAARGIGSQADADTATATYEAAKAQLASAQAALAQAQAAARQAETNLAYTVIESPIDGIVISRDVDVGQTVAASLQTPTLYTLAEDLRVMQVHTNVAEADVGRLEPGMPVEFTVDAWPDLRFEGVVEQIRYAPETVQNVVTYDAVVSVDNPELKLRPGMTADVSFLVAEREDALLVPNAALRFAPPAAVVDRLGDVPSPEQALPPEPGAPHAPARLVWVQDGERGIPRPVPVRIGITDGRVTEIVAGELAVGDRVVVGATGGPAAGDGRPRFGRFL